MDNDQTKSRFVRAIHFYVDTTISMDINACLASSFTFYASRCESNRCGMAGRHIARRLNDYAEGAVVSTPYNTLVDINELSRRLSVPKGTLYNWCYLRRIPFIKAGRSLRFDPDEVIQSLPHSPTMDLAGQRWKGH